MEPQSAATVTVPYHNPLLFPNRTTPPKKRSGPEFFSRVPRAMCDEARHLHEEVCEPLQGELVHGVDDGEVRDAEVED